MKSTAPHKRRRDPRTSLVDDQARAQAGLSSLQANGMSLAPTPQPIPSSASQTFTSEHTFLSQVGDLVIKDQAFAISQSEDDVVFENAAFDGIVGLSFPSMAIEGTTPIFDSLMNQSLIAQTVFAFYLSR